MGVPKSITYLHNREVGGSTMHGAFRKREETGSLELHVALSWRMRNEMGIAAYVEAWNRKLPLIVASQQHAMGNTHTDSNSNSHRLYLCMMSCSALLVGRGTTLESPTSVPAPFASCMEPEKDQTESNTVAKLLTCKL
jgi:hypothetical protein